MARKRVLITGAAGRIGHVCARDLRERYDLRLMYHNTPLEEDFGLETVQGATHDLARMEEIVDGMDAIVHMAGNPSLAASWEAILEANIVGLYNVYEAAHRRGVKRIVFASSNHATGFYEKEGVYTTVAMPARPDSYYGVSKVFGEDMARYYHDEFGMEIISIRIGSFQPDEAVINRKSDRILATWLSHRDCVQMVWRGIESPTKYGIYYGISGNTRAYWDISNARQELGYEPEDDSERLV